VQRERSRQQRGAPNNGSNASSNPLAAGTHSANITVNGVDRSEADDPPLASYRGTIVLPIEGAHSALSHSRSSSANVERVFASLQHDRKRRRQRWSHWGEAGVLLVLSGVALFIVGVVDVAQLTLLGYLLFLAGTALLMHSSGLHPFARDRITSRSRRRSADWPR
jgi:hypothetical protein